MKVEDEYFVVNIVILKTPQEIAKLAADRVVGVVRGNASPVLGLATGASPLMLYDELVKRYKHNEVSFDSTTTFNLDEYYGVAESSRVSYRHYMHRHFFSHIDIPEKNTYLPQSVGKDPERTAGNYEAKIHSAGGIDLQILGIGSNGHIGFNEPGSSFASRTRISVLAPSTVNDNRQYFEKGEDQPTLAITMGIASILAAKQLLLIATGSNKSQSVRDMLEGPVSVSCPASALQLHANVTVMLDPPAAEKLSYKDYYHYRQRELAAFAAV
jgi:glucosamine-6-phosphate deaminase